ncbi:MAG TPA: SRPBCC family protein [Nocardioidaceae bacterium]|nr:SRPBCC family protein [Nocardioidaceae bacterium]
MTAPLATRQFEEGRAVLRFERRLAHPPEKVWRAVTEPDELAHWFPGRVEMELRPGAPVHFVEDDPDIGESSGEVVEVDPPKVFAFRWGGDLLRFELAPDGSGCRLSFSHALSGGDTWGDERFAAQHAAGWDACLELLLAWLAGESADPESTDAGSMADWFVRNEEYIEEFGLAEGEVVEDADGSVLRFERVVIQTPDEVWAALTSAGAPAVGSPAPATATPPAIDAGVVTALEPGRTLVYEWRHDGTPVGEVRWTISGRKYAGRIVLTQTVPAELADQQASLLASWQAQMERFIAGMHDLERPWPDDRVELHRKHYADQLAG